MKIITIISQKGGAGKTTLALNLAAASVSLGHETAIIDLDPQASASNWHDTRDEEKKNNPVVISAQAARLPHILETAKNHGMNLVIIDTAPHAETSALDAAKVADLVLIPCRPSVLDLRALSTSIDLATLSGTKTAAVLNAIPARGTMADEAETFMKSKKLTLCPVRLGNRAAFIHSMTNGQTVLEYEPNGKASNEINSVYMWACRHASMSSLSNKNKRRIKA